MWGASMATMAAVWRRVGGGAILLAGAAAALALLPLADAQAQAYPAKPVRVIIPYPP